MAAVFLQQGGTKMSFRVAMMEPFYIVILGGS